MVSLINGGGLFERRMLGVRTPSLACALRARFQRFKIVPDDFVASLYPAYKYIMRSHS